MKLKHF